VNTFRRPRKRPRDKSVNFRTFGWVVLREAFIRVTEHAAPTALSERLRREAVRDSSDKWVREVGQAFIRSNPERRFRP